MPTDAPIGLPAAFAIRLAAIALTLAAHRLPRASRWFAFGGSSVASVITGLASLAVLSGSPASRGMLLLHSASGMVIGYSLDALSAWFLMVLSLLAIPIALFSIGYVAHIARGARSAFLGVTFNVLLTAVELVFCADDVVGFLFGWELMTLATAALVVTEHEVRATRRAGYLYLVMSHVGTGCLFAAFLLLSSRAGSLSFTAMLRGGDIAGPWRDVLFVLFLFGFGVKAGIIPLHVWLPEAHPAAPSSISALMSGVLIKTGIYGIVRFCAFGLGTPSHSWGVVIVVLGGLSSVLGVLYALMQHDLKRLLAYHSIENIGIILLGLGAGMIALAGGQPELAAIGVAASLYHVLNHAMFKGLLFLGAGGVVVATGTRQIEQLGGLLRRMPWTGLCFLIGAMAISGLPPLNGFASEWLTFQAFLYGFHTSSDPLVRSLFPVAGALLALTTALAAACFVKAFGITFLALPRSRAAAEARESTAVMLAPQVILAVLCLMLGLFPGIVVGVLSHVMASSLPGLIPRAEMVRGPSAIAPGPGTFDAVAPLALGALIVGSLGAVSILVLRRRASVRLVPTWGCGGELGPRTEYTATAFSKPLMMIFRAVYRPTRRVETLAEVSPYFPREVQYHAEIEPTFERYVYEPLLRGVLHVADRMKMLQAGSLHAYLGYVIALVLTLVLIVWWIG
jgi:hydrogenase-4 component B